MNFKKSCLENKQSGSLLSNKKHSYFPSKLVLIGRFDVTYLILTPFTIRLAIIKSFIIKVSNQTLFYYFFIIATLILDYFFGTCMAFYFPYEILKVIFIFKCMLTIKSLSTPSN